MLDLEEFDNVQGAEAPTTEYVETNNDLPFSAFETEHFFDGTQETVS